ncbi:MAG: threonine/serine dehydratase [Devosia sp.]|uniref:threonine/serine dehydratase n=1 Tax=Devosia sp. TaxID=1871048 RepID=UPI001AD2A070|nr:threonine/serine dehydratase [Devosia sp.]MBN9316256.1 threonine/serine dehydratase [Devosia sp.]
MTNATEIAVPDRNAILAAEAVIRPHIRRTPVLDTPAADFGLSGAPLNFKLEFMQHSGTFKARGAFANLLMRKGAERGVVAASGGNHGAAVAYAAMKLGIRAHIYVPRISSPAKIERIKQYGAEITVGGEAYADAYAASQAFAREHGLIEVHAYDGYETLCGQGMVGLEWLEQAPEVDTLLVAVGGGGLIGGIAAAVGGRVRIVGVEPENAPTLFEATKAGRPVDVPVSGVAADSLGARRIGQLCFALSGHIDRTVLVTDEAIVAAQKTVWDVLRLVVEPGGAAAMAALLSGRYVPAPDERVGVLLCGANTTAVKFE